MVRTRDAVCRSCVKRFWLNVGYLQHSIDNFISQFVRLCCPSFCNRQLFFVCDCLLFCLSGVVVCNSGFVIHGKGCSVMSLSG